MEVISASDLRVKNVIELNSEMYYVREIQHVKPGKGGAFIQTTLENFYDHSKRPERFRVEDKVVLINLYENTAIFLYKDLDYYTFLNIEDGGAEVQVSINLIHHKEFFTDGIQVQLLFKDNECVGVKLPQQIKSKIKSTAPFVKGQTKNASSKVAILDVDPEVIVSVPQYIEAGDIILISFDDDNKIYFHSRIKDV